MHCLARRSVASTAARHTESDRRLTTSFTASLRSSRPLGLFRYTWDLRCRKKSGRLKFVEHAGHGCVSAWSRLRRILVDFHEIFRGYVDFGWGPMPKAVPQVYQNHTRSLEDLKDAVKPVVRRLTLSVCRAAAAATVRRAKQCIERNGGHVEHVLGVVQDGDRGRSKSSQTKYICSDFQVTPGSFS